MDRPVLVPPPNIPIIGQPMRFVCWHPMAVVLCDCGPNRDSEVLTLFKVGVPTQCPKCKALYAIAAIDGNKCLVNRMIPPPTE